MNAARPVGPRPARQPVPHASKGFGPFDDDFNPFEDDEETDILLPLE